MVDSLGRLAAFVKVADTLNFTAAASELGLSPSALGKTIGRLEEDVGVRLFHRNTRGMKPTAEGLSFLKRCRRILAEYDAARAELSEAATAPRGRLKMSLPLASIIGPDLLAGFAAAYPEVELDLDFTDRVVDVIDEGFDAVVRTGEAADSRLMTRFVTSFRHRVVASAGYLSKHGVPATLADLAHHGCLLYRFPSTGKLELWPLQGAERLGPLRAVATFNAIEPLLDVACAGLGLACLPDFAVEAHIASGRLESVLDDQLGSRRDLRILWPNGRPTPPKIRAFIDFMSARIPGSGPVHEAH